MFMSKEKKQLPQFTPEELAGELFGVDYDRELGELNQVLIALAAPFAGVGERSPEAGAFWDYTKLWSWFYNVKYIEVFGDLPKHIREAVSKNYPGDDLWKMGQIWQVLRMPQTRQALVREYSDTIERRKKGSIRYQRAAQYIEDRIGTMPDIEQRHDISPKEVLANAHFNVILLGKTHEIILASRRLVKQQPSRRPKQPN